MMGAQALLFVGGVRSGKSSLALRWADAHAGRRLFLATCVLKDAEMAERIDRHRAERGPAWNCLEEGLDPRKALEAHLLSRDTDKPGVILFDCVSMWVANLLEAGLTSREGMGRIVSFVKYLAGLDIPAAFVSAEAGLGLVPPNPVGRRFQDMLGLANQALACACGTVVFAACGLPLLLKGSLPEELC
ncbi:MAG: bifunctional adenosylcobinamide kinase/adenosylcobinamide-phosphate guanylyltransferase [Desulfovibrio sp.]|jgi:adenosylcobinamide kinase/adenosylcobinamide-phosphate guanylyltransferase|nr:bifunctional adenosylcobinamide kinase/adenosylcobinamide-phosphate guanylyltransferase [Desulfovibrio sp.]